MTIALARNAPCKGTAIVLVIVANDTTLTELSFKASWALTLLNPVCRRARPFHRGRLQLHLVEETLPIGDVVASDLDCSDVGEQPNERL
jgi:hypothetical protein